MTAPAAGRAGKVVLGPDRDQLRIGDRFTVAFQRTLRVPEDGKVYPLPPGLGRLPIQPASELKGSAGLLAEPGAFIIPLYQREALWLGFGGAEWKPNAVQVAVGGVNAVSGQPWTHSLSDAPQNYLVCPQQPWLDGINAGAGHIRQFVALQLGDARTIEAQVRGEAKIGGIQIRVFEPRPGRFPEKPPPPRPEPRRAAGFMGLGAGGKVVQRIHPDPFGLEAWDLESATSVFVYIVNSAQFEAMTGRKPPPSPVDAGTYSKHGFPWFQLYDETAGDVAPVPEFDDLTPTGGPDEDEETVAIDPGQVRPIRPRRGST
jgi:hypothetical protein